MRKKGKGKKKKKHAGKVGRNCFPRREKRGREKSWTERRGEPEPPVAREVDQERPGSRLHLREPERAGGEGRRESGGRR